MKVKYFLIYIVILTCSAFACTDSVQTHTVIKETNAFTTNAPAKSVRCDEIDYYDSAGVHSDSAINHTIYYFDASGALTQTEWWHAPTQTYLTEQYVYDSLGRKIASSSNHSLKCMTSSEYFYNDAGQLIRIESYSEEGNLMNIESFTYNSRGLRVEHEITLETRGCGAHEPGITYIAYDDQGQKVRSRSEFSTVGVILDYAYSYSGDTTFEYEYGQDYRSLKNTVYSDFDKKNTWTKSTWTCKMSETTNRVVITTRTIEYY